MRKSFNDLLDLEFEYKDHALKFQDVVVRGTVSSGLATLSEPSWREVRFEICMTPNQVQEWVVEEFEDNDQPVPPWARTDGAQILIEMRDHVETHIFID